MRCSDCRKSPANAVRLQERGALHAAGKALAGQRECRIERVEQIEHFSPIAFDRACVPVSAERLRHAAGSICVNGAPRLQLIVVHSPISFGAVAFAVVLDRPSP